jgi:WD40 repeat protein
MIEGVYSFVISMGENLCLFSGVDIVYMTLNGTVIATTFDLDDKGTGTGGSDVIRIVHPIKDRIRAVGQYNGQLCIAGDDKSLCLFSTDWSVGPTTIKTTKRINKIVMTEDTILVADKFGDVYKYNYHNNDEGNGNVTLSKARLILGHVSICTDMILYEQWVITADRDEKIRVSKYPNAFDIDCFLLGHTEFVSRLVCLGDQLVSGGGDDFLIQWDLATRSMVGRVDLKEWVGEKEMKLCLRSMVKHPKEEKCILLFDHILSLFVVGIVDGRVVVEKVVPVKAEPIAADYTDSGILIVTYNTSQPQPQPILLASMFNSEWVSSPLIVPTPPTVETMIDVYELSNIRKWNHWNPQGLLQPRVDEEALHLKKKQKTKRGGLKQKQKKEMMERDGENNLGDVVVV